MDRLELLEIAAARFNELVAQTGEDAWDRPTPCEKWSVGQLVDHVIGGNNFTVEILAGNTAPKAIDAAKAAFTATTDRKQMSTASLAAQSKAFAEPGARERICHHVIGDMPGDLVLRLRLTELTVHGWDLARGIGADDTIPTDLITAAWSDIKDNSAALAASGRFGTGPSGRFGEGDDLQSRLLDATGRTP